MKIDREIFFKNIITISGNLGSGKTTLSKFLADALDMKIYASGDIMRQQAEKNGMDINEFNKFLLSHPEYDKLVDAEIVHLANSFDNLIFVSRIAWYFIPSAFNIFLYVNDEIGAKRILADQLRISEKYENYTEALKSIKKRFTMSRNRFYEVYGIDICDNNNYDLYLDTTNMSMEEVKNKILKEYQYYLAKGGKNKYEESDNNNENKNRFVKRRSEI